MFERVDQDEETVSTVTSSGLQRNLHFIVIYYKIKSKSCRSLPFERLVFEASISVQFNSRVVSQNFGTLAELQVVLRAILQGHSSRHVLTVIETPFS